MEREYLILKAVFTLLSLGPLIIGAWVSMCLLQSAWEDKRPVFSEQRVNEDGAVEVWAHREGDPWQLVQLIVRDHTGAVTGVFTGPESEEWRLAYGRRLLQ